MTQPSVAVPQHPPPSPIALQVHGVTMMSHRRASHRASHPTVRGGLLADGHAALERDWQQLDRYAAHVDSAVTAVVLLESVTTTLTSRLRSFVAPKGQPDRAASSGVHGGSWSTDTVEHEPAWLNNLATSQGHVATALVDMKALERTVDAS